MEIHSIVAKHSAVPGELHDCRVCLVDFEVAMVASVAHEWPQREPDGGVAQVPIHDAGRVSTLRQLEALLDA